MTSLLGMIILGHVFHTASHCVLTCHSRRHRAGDISAALGEPLPGVSVVMACEVLTQLTSMGTGDYCAFLS
jgi:hypothetical protein